MEQQRGISKLDLKRQNRMQVLYILQRQGPISRIDIASKLGLTRAAVTIITNEMIEQGILLEAGEMQYDSDKAPKGRKKILLEINQNYRLALGVLVEDSQVSVGLSTLSGNVLDKKNLNYDGTISGSAIEEFIIRSCREMMDNNCLAAQKILGVGVGVQPSMYPKLGISLRENLDPDFSSLLKTLGDGISLPIAIDNSICALTLANVDFARQKPAGLQNFIFLRCGRHYNLLFVNDDQPQWYFNNYTRMVESMIVSAGGSEWRDYPRGSVMAELSFDAVIEMAKRFYSESVTPALYELTRGNKENVSMALLREAAIRGDRPVLRLMEQRGDLLGVLLHNLYCAYCPKKIVLQNFCSSLEEFEKLKKWIEQGGYQEVSSLLTWSVVDAKHSFLGGCALIIQEMFFNRGGYCSETDTVLKHSSRASYLPATQEWKTER